MRRYTLRDILVRDTRNQQSFVQGRRKGGGYSGAVRRRAGIGGHDGREERGERGSGEEPMQGEEMELEDMLPRPALDPHSVHHHGNPAHDDEESEDDLDSFIPSRPFRTSIRPFQPHVLDQSLPRERGDTPTSTTLFAMGYDAKAEQGMLPSVPGRGFVDPFGLTRGWGRRVKTPPINPKAIEEYNERIAREAEEAREMGGGNMEVARGVFEEEGYGWRGLLDEDGEDGAIDRGRERLGRGLRGLSLSPMSSSGGRRGITGLGSQALTLGIYEDAVEEGGLEYSDDGENDGLHEVVGEGDVEAEIGGGDGESNSMRRDDLRPSERRVVLGELREDDPRLGGLGLEVE